GFPGASVPWSSTDVLSPDEEAELEALRSEAAQLRQEALQNAAAEGLERKVELLQREFRLAVEERQRLAKQLRPQRLVEETTGKEQAMISAKRLLANLLASRQLSSGVSTAAIEAAERAARAVRKFQPSELTVSANSLASVR
ncbi:unnamed protein product, partial [Effrenium voratum]